MKSYRKRKAEVRSVKKDGVAKDCWPADAGTEDVDNRKALCPVKRADEERWPVKPEGRLLADGRLCGLYEKMHGERLPASGGRYRS